MITAPQAVLMRAGVFVRWVAHPSTVGATAVLLLNDHVFKQAWPGLVTGKLSDFAGLAMAPAVLGLLSGLFRAGRIGAAAAILLTGAGFAWVKVSTVGAEAASAAWSVVNGPSVILADPTDLVALPALGLAWWAWRRVEAAPPLPDGPAHRVRVLLAVPFALMAIAATSPPPRLPSADSVQLAGENGEQVVIGMDGWRFFSSPSGVGDWTRLPETPPEQRQEHRPQVEACVPGDAAHCYRVHGGGELDAREATPRGGRLLGVDETTDAGRTWHTAWEVPATRWEFVERQHPLFGGVEGPSKVASVEVVVRTVPGGHEVIVANGVEGLAIRSADGTWRRVPVVTDSGVISPAPLTAFGRNIGDDIANAALITVLALLIGLCVAAGRARTRAGSMLVVLLPLTLLLLVGVPILGLVLGFGSRSGAATESGLVYALLLAGTAICLSLAQDVLRRARTLVVSAAAVLTGLAFLAPVLGWTVGHPAVRDSAVILGLVLAAGCLGLVVAAGWWTGRDPVPRLTDPPWPSPPVPGPVQD